MYELDMMYAFLGFIVFFAMVIELSKWSFRVVGGAFSYYCLQHLNDPLKKPTTMKKWCDQGWQMVIHVSK
jgi:ceramide synthetase